MSRKKILGRASLSFPAIDGILDVDQILQTDPWKEVDDFVQRNFAQNILNEFNERLALKPKLSPADNTSPGKRRATSSRRSPRKSEASRTNEAKSPKKKEDDQQPVGGDAKLNEREEEIAKKSGKAEVSTSKEEKVSKAKHFLSSVPPSCLLPAANVSKDRVDDAEKSETYSQRLKDGPKVTVERLAATTAEKSSGTSKNEEEERIVDDAAGTTEQRETDDTDPMNDRTKNTPKDTSTISAKTSESADSKSPFRTSTPRRSRACEQDNSSGKEAAATTKRDNSSPKRDSSVRRNASTNHYSARDACVTKDLNNNNSAAKKNEGKKTKVRCKYKKMEKVKEEKKTSEISTKTASRCKEDSKKMAKTEMKQIGKEKHLLKQRQRHYKEKIRRIEKKADRAMETYIHHVTSIIKKVGYLSERSSCSENDDNYSDFSDESSCCDSYCSDNCCSYYSDSCCSSCDYSEYTLFSSSSSSSSSSSPSSSSSSSSSACGPLLQSKTK